MINRVGRFTLIRWADGARTLRLTIPGYAHRAPKLRHGWKLFFVAHIGHDRTTYSYRRS